MNRNVLIADGDAALLDVYRRFLTVRGFQVETARDGVDCLAKIKQRTPAAVVVDRDLLWGGSDGVVACLSEQSATAELPVILMSPDAAVKVDFDGDGSSAVRMLRKPFVLRDLLASVCAALASRAERTE